MAENQKTVEKSMASLTISSPPQDPIDGSEPYSAERFDVDAGFETFFAMCEKLKSTVFYPVTIPVMGTQIPGTDCFRHNTVQGRRDKMVDFYPVTLAYFNKKYNTDYEYVDCVDLIASGVVRLSLQLHCQT
ncbi:uncharacterized protein LOC110720375 [Chenopodium quinoa]|uniref:uncharacterized protein LOC110720375 n=1 Tax=Chenopodium quinoa TaxID=63459 RepID=UPI000B77DEE4|nr:uncharacterized protein LOC110720375 [Chenopodium quinoa]